MVFTDEDALLFMRTFKYAIQYGIRLQGVPNRYRADVYQEVRIRIMNAFREEKVDLGRSDKSILDWVITVSRNTASHFMSKHREQVTDADINQLPERRVANPEDKPTDALVRLRKAIKQLPMTQRSVIEYTLAGVELREIAEHMEIPVGTIKRLAHDARQNLRKLLITGSVLLFTIAACDAQEAATDSTLLEQQVLLRAVHLHRTLGVPDAFTLDSLATVIIERTLNTLAHQEYPCAPGCPYRYGRWSKCVDGLQQRDVLDRGPPGCVGWPATRRPCH